jgi:hypothetical protein
MARHDLLDDSLSGPHASSGLSAPLAPVPAPPAFSPSIARARWKNLLWLSIAAVGVGFAGYLYLMPYRQLTGTLETRSRELHQEREEGHQLATERDQLKSSVDKFQSSEKDRSDKVAKAQQEMDALAAQLKPALQELGAAISTDQGRMLISLAPEKSIDKNGIDVSGEGAAVLKILAGAIKRGNAVVHIKARFGSGPAPKQLRSLFGTTGEVSAVRAARVMSALEGAGLPPERLTIVGAPESSSDAPRPLPRGSSRRRRAAAAAAAATTTEDRLDIEVEPG